MLYTMKVYKDEHYPQTPIPLELFIVVLSIAVMRIFGLKEKWGIKMVGDYPISKGFPPFSLPSMKHWAKLVFPSIVVGIVCYASTIAVSKNNARAVGVAWVSHG